MLTFFASLGATVMLIEVYRLLRFVYYMWANPAGLSEEYSQKATDNLVMAVKLKMLSERK